MLKQALPFFVGTSAALLLFAAGFTVGNAQQRYTIEEGSLLDTRTGTVYYVDQNGVSWESLDGSKGSRNWK